MARQPHELLPLHPRDHALLVCLSEEDLHGYALMDRVQSVSRGRIRVGPATLYRTLDRMESEGLVAQEAPRAGDGSGPPRTPYRLTEFGRRVLLAETERLADLVARVRGGDPTSPVG